MFKLDFRKCFLYLPGGGWVVGWGVKINNIDPLISVETETVRTQGINIIWLHDQGSFWIKIGWLHDYSQIWSVPIRTQGISKIWLHDYSSFFRASIKIFRFWIADYVTTAKFRETLSEPKELT